MIKHILVTYQEISSKLFLQYANYDTDSGINNMVTLVLHNANEFLTPEYAAENIQTSNNTLIINGKIVNSRQSLTEAIDSQSSFDLGTDANGCKLSLLKNGRIVSTAASVAQPAVQTPVQQPVQQFVPQPASQPVVQPEKDESVTTIIDNLVEKLNKASSDYYYDNLEVMDNIEYDAEKDKLAQLEEETGYVRDDSPTQHVGAPLPASAFTIPAGKQGSKVRHEYQPLSLDKTKSVADLIKWIGNQKAVLSVKMDGLTICLTYDNGKLVQAVTRGNGIEGELITDNALNIKGIPTYIPYTGKVIVRGEGYIPEDTFRSINESVIASGKAPYKNARNLAAGTIRTFDNPNVVAQRGVCFAAFEIGNWEDLKLPYNTFTYTLNALKQLGFTDIIKHTVVTANTINDAILSFTEEVKESVLPADGLVLRLDDLEYGESLGNTGSFPRHSIAFKWEDAEVETELVNIDWTIGRSGIITPTAVFKPVELEGSTISRASLHNISQMEKTLGRPYKGQRIWVYKANMIIPQVSRAIKYEELAN